MVKNNQDIIACLVAVALTLGLTLVGSDLPYLTLVRLPLGLISVLFVPGYLMLTALPCLRDLEGTLGIGIAMGLSLALVPFLALTLNFSGVGISPLTVAASLLILTMPLATLATWRRRGAVVGSAARPVKGWNWRQIPVGGWLAVASLALLVVGGAGVSYAVSQTPPPPYTEFYMLNASGQAQDYPQVASASVPLTVTLGVINDEGVAASYRVTVMDAGKVVTEIAVGKLAAGQTWERASYLSLPAGGGEQVVQLLLYKDGVDPPYRQLRLILGRTGTWEGE